MKLYSKTIKRYDPRKTRQEKLVDFVYNDKNVKKAIEGSMKQRMDLFNRVNYKKT